MATFKNLLILCLTLSATFSHAAAKQEWTGKSNSEKVALLEEYQYCSGTEDVKELPGAKIICDLNLAELKKNKYLPYAQSMVNFLISNTDDPGGDYTFKKRGDHGENISILIDEAGEVLGGRAYVIREFAPFDWRGWVDGYFSEKADFLGRGDNYDDYLQWSHY